MSEKPKIEPYTGPAGGWGSVRSVEGILTREGRLVTGNAILLKQNKPDGYACVSCAWAKPADPHPFEYCENGAKATAWELTTKRVTPEFFAEHRIAELRTWSDHDLEEAGRLTHPMRWDKASDRYLPVSWEEAFREIGRELQGFEDPDQVIFYCSGRASLETSYMWALFARLYGTNNLPDSSNMCHESTSVALPESIGVSVGTVLLDDFKKTDCIFFFGQNVGTNSPRMLHPLQEASKRGVPIVTFNPLRERGLERFTNPQAPTEMLTGSETRISSQYHQVKAGGDIAAIMGMCKALVESDDKARSEGRPPILDHAFIAEHTHGFEDFVEAVRSYRWPDLESQSGLPRAALEAAAAEYARAKAVIGIYGMGLTQHRTGVENVQMVVNLLLLRGNIGKEGAGICPVRGHSNVQGQRTVGISEKPELVPLDKLKEKYNFEPPRKTGMNTVEACEGIIKGEVKAFLGLGGNFVRAVPETAAMEHAWSRLRLTVQISTKLNRSHLIHGEVAYILPCLGRIEIDEQETGPQAVSIEDSTTCIHGSKGHARPASPDLLSEPKIVAEMAKAALPPKKEVPWDEWVADYARVRDAIEETYPDDFRDFNDRMWQPGGFPRPVAARDRQWKTKTGKANFIVPRSLEEALGLAEESRDILKLMTVRSNDQFNTTVYGYHDRFRGIKGTRRVILMNRNDMARLGLEEGEMVTLRTAVDDGVSREVSDMRVTPYDVPEGCCASYYPECNPLIPLWHHAERSKVPAAKSIPIRIERMGARIPEAAE
ncbi:FdhF/YdeP family oxidoreductase [Microvirga lenta]|uniref:FdhF/YdeP family oxidoreductase n=1 Tax=Microvirga lenta TaxID=2881337 RepID=UPI001CFFCC10|nr:FdhF/YdeP family oxidoreductase [Microvirga lenta]MCB5175715.1 FdhF/YdeP family oxidoreductase [Microvirga lenta]